MVDYTRYSEIKTKTKGATGFKYEDFDGIGEAFDRREKQVNNVLAKLLSEGYEIIDIKYNDMTYGPNHSYVYAVATIVYGKPKPNKK